MHQNEMEMSVSGLSEVLHFFLILSCFLHLQEKNTLIPRRMKPAGAGLAPVGPGLISHQPGMLDSRGILAPASFES